MREIAPAAGMGGDGSHQIVLYRHGRKTACDLEGASDATMHPLRLGQPEDILAVEQHLTGVGRERAADQVEEGRLASTVWSDHSRQRTGRKHQRHVVDGAYATKGFGKIFDLKFHCPRLLQTSRIKSSTPRRRPSAKARI